MYILTNLQKNKPFLYIFYANQVGISLFSQKQTVLLYFSVTTHLVCVHSHKPMKKINRFYIKLLSFTTSHVFSFNTNDILYSFCMSSICLFGYIFLLCTFSLNCQNNKPFYYIFYTNQIRTSYSHTTPMSFSTVFI